MMRCDPETTPGPLLPLCPSSRSEPRTHETQELGGVVQQIVTRLLPDGYPGVETVAEMVRVSARTLQRRLSEEGLTFAGLVARARFDVAQRMLDDPARKVVDVALDLGYSDHAHFTRAFVRWTGLSPREFRRVRSTTCSCTARVAGGVNAMQNQNGVRVELVTATQGLKCAPSAPTG
jgi:AraC-like DNA-binding protein